MKKILQTLSQKWAEYLLEILVLIIGIYGAFALENWREAATENRNNRQILTSLRGGLEDALTKVKIIAQDEAAFMENMKSFLQRPDTLTGLPHDEYMTIIWSGDETSISIDQYVEFEDFDKLNTKSKSIITGISSIENRIDDIKSGQADRLTVQQMRIDPYIIYHTDLSALLNTGDTTLQLYEFDQFDKYQILNQLEFRNAIALKFSITEALFNRYQVLETELNQAITSINDILNP